MTTELEQASIPQLYDSNERYGHDASELDEKIYCAIRPLMDEYLAKGYRAREIAHIMHGTIFDLECMTVLKG
jgi:hypothetical protein